VDGAAFAGAAFARAAPVCVHLGCCPVAHGPAACPPLTSSAPVTYTPAEMMTAVAARELRDGEVVFVGIGLPNLACNLARATHAPNLLLIYESGAIGAIPERLPVSIGDPSLVTGSLMVCGMADVFQSLLQNGRIEVGFLGGAQVDRYGNINTTVVGSYAHPEVRLPGSGGAAEIAIHARRTVVISRLSRRAFPEAVDFITSPGHRAHGRTRRELGMPGAGPVKVVTDKAILEADPETGELVLAALYPGVSAGEVGAGVGWPLRTRPQPATLDPPTAGELALLRDVLDPHRLYLKG
jgi:glutaconate CoA-transferase subunit B